MREGGHGRRPPAGERAPAVARATAGERAVARLPLDGLPAPLVRAAVEAIEWLGRLERDAASRPADARRPR